MTAGGSHDVHIPAYKTSPTPWEIMSVRAPRVTLSETTVFHSISIPFVAITIPLCIILVAGWINFLIKRRELPFSVRSPVITTVQTIYSIYVIGSQSANVFWFNSASCFHLVWGIWLNIIPFLGIVVLKVFRLYAIATLAEMRASRTKVDINSLSPIGWLRNLVFVSVKTRVRQKMLVNGGLPLFLMLIPLVVLFGIPMVKSILYPNIISANYGLECLAFFGKDLNQLAGDFAVVAVIGLCSIIIIVCMGVDMYGKRGDNFYLKQEIKLWTVVALVLGLLSLALTTVNRVELNNLLESQNAVKEVNGEYHIGDVGYNPVIILSTATPICALMFVSTFITLFYPWMKYDCFKETDEEKRQADAWAGKNFDTFINDEIRRKYFIDYLVSEFCAELMAFYMIASDWGAVFKENRTRLIDGQADLQQIISDASRIHKQYIKSGSRDEINIGHSDRQKITASIDRATHAVEGLHHTPSNRLSQLLERFTTRPGSCSPMATSRPRPRSMDAKPVASSLAVQCNNNNNTNNTNTNTNTNNDTNTNTNTNNDTNTNNINNNNNNNTSTNNDTNTNNNNNNTNNDTKSSKSSSKIARAGSEEGEEVQGQSESTPHYQHGLCPEDVEFTRKPSKRTAQAAAQRHKAVVHLDDLFTHAISVSRKLMLPALRRFASSAKGQELQLEEKRRRLTDNPMVDIILSEGLRLSTSDIQVSVLSIAEEEIQDYGHRDAMLLTPCPSYEVPMTLSKHPSLEGLFTSPDVQAPDTWNAEGIYT